MFASPTGDDQKSVVRSDRGRSSIPKGAPATPQSSLPDSAVSPADSSHAVRGDTMQELVHWKDGQTRHHTVFGRLSTRPGLGGRVIFVAVFRESHGLDLRWLLYLLHRLILVGCFDATKTPTRPEKQTTRPSGTGLMRFHFSGRSCLGCTARHLP
jgi:hypothetical protein